MRICPRAFKRRKRASLCCSDVMPIPLSRTQKRISHPAAGDIESQLDFRQHAIVRTTTILDSITEVINPHFLNPRTVSLHCGPSLRTDDFCVRGSDHIAQALHRLPDNRSHLQNTDLQRPSGAHQPTAAIRRRYLAILRPLSAIARRNLRSTDSGSELNSCSKTSADPMIIPNGFFRSCATVCAKASNSSISSSRSSSARLRSVMSRKTSTKPVTLPRSSLIGALLSSTGVFVPSFATSNVKLEAREALLAGGKTGPRGPRMRLYNIGMKYLRQVLTHSFGLPPAGQGFSHEDS